ncbi:hypothetical protein KP509_01G060100 [Ceratopteris richardii]|uniref:Uncharacterized protein n=1 Tax=Ceratopteris richardii TaxID=49495 RepID=A0A8T2VLS1_CERRI|nr:hypothetical protein KP509_01G060100 [Ceratopteris richardii]KAH7446515.1 hypothetical protein KP509_01G060100 [Ceratopteris richardii]
MDSFSNMYAATLIFAGLSALIFIHLRRKRHLPPGPRPRAFVGNLYDITPVRFRCFWEWSKVYGPIISIWFGSTLNVIVSSSELAKEVLKEKDQLLAARNRTRAANLFSRNGQDLIWADYGPHYVKVRKICTLELFTPKRLEALRHLREDEVASMVESIFKDCGGKGGGEQKAIVVKKYLSAVAFNNITRIAFGKRFVDSDGNIDPQGVEFKEIISQGMKLGASIKTSEFIPWIRWMFPLQKEEFLKHGARRDKLTKLIMQEHTIAREKSGETKQHFVDALLTLQKQHDLSDTHIIGLLWDMITAGMDTTAISVEWAMAELVRNPNVQQKAQEELDRVIGMEDVVKEVDFAKLPYLQCIVKESLRLHPPTPLMLPHKATEDVKIGGYDVPKGTVVHVNVWAIARDPVIWKDPLTFRPERFLEEDVDIKGHDFRLLPFGAGRRVCPGAQLGLNLVQLMLARLLHQFSWSPPEGMQGNDIDMTERPGVVTFMAKPLEAVAQPRLPGHLYSR